ncbi:MAG: MerR family transcriptional regulator [Bacteroidetes bacterium]|nr:MerR family transcriptional regulator [Bacteroidota bacterium]
MQPKLQQLDLFGGPALDIGGVKEKKKAKPKAIPEVASIVETPVPAIEEPVVAAAIYEAPFVTESVAVEPSFVEPVYVEPVYVERPRQPRVTIEKIAGKRGRKSYSEIDTEVDLIEIPDEKVLSQKLYYTISEVASWFKVNTSLLRYWENEFDILKPRKTRKGDRLFRVEDIKNLQIIYFLLRQKKYSIEGARTYLKQNKSQADTEAQLVQTLTKFKTFLLELKAGLH